VRNGLAVRFGTEFCTDPSELLKNAFAVRHFEAAGRDATQLPK
jgi:hypothetical protein